MNSQKKILVCGIGSLGGVFAFKLIKEGFNCKLVTKNENITKIINKNGLSLENSKGIESIKAQASTDLPENQEFDYILLMMKSTSVKEAAIEIKGKKLLKPNGIIITVQNGDVYEQISDIFPNKIVTCIIVWGASMIEPGMYKITSPGKTFLGDRNKLLNLVEIQSIISKISPVPVELSENILGIIWAKLCVNCAINAIAGISGLTIGEFTKQKAGWELFLAVYRETVELAEKQKIKLEKLVTNPYLLYIPKRSNFIKKRLKIFFVKQVGKRYGLVKPSMLQDIERGRLTEIDYLNGYVSKKGLEFNFPTSVNDQLKNMIKDIQNNKLKPEIANLSVIII